MFFLLNFNLFFIGSSFKSLTFLLRSHIVGDWLVKLTRVDPGFFFQRYFLKVDLFFVSSFDTRLLGFKLFCFVGLSRSHILGHVLVKLTRVIIALIFFYIRKNPTQPAT